MKRLISQELRKDKRVTKAKQLLLEALADHQQSITGLKEAEPGLKESYADLIRRTSELRGGALYYPYLSSGIGKGPLVELADGSVKYDFISGIGVHCLGHSHPKLLESGIDAALEDTVMQGNLQQGAVTAELLETLVREASRFGAKLKHCFLTSSGAMANENALKMIFQKKSPAGRFLAFERCFAGRTLATAQMTDKPLYRKGLPPVLPIDYIPFFDPEHPEESTEKSVKALKACCERFKGEYAGMCFELIQGEGGYYPGERSFFTALMDILKEHQIAVMVDEIQTFGRTPELFAFQYFGLDQYVDVVTIGKMTQVCATLFTEEFKPEPGLISQTFTASTSAVYAARAIMDEILNNGYLGENGKIMQYSKRFTKHLHEIAKRHPGSIKGPFGFGGMIGLTAFGGSLEKTKLFLKELFEAGIIAFLAGKSPARVRFLMPVGGVSPEEIDEVCRIIEKTVERVSGKTG